MRGKRLDKGSEPHRQRYWNKYRVDLNRYVYTVDGKMVCRLTEEEYESNRRKSAKLFDKYIDEDRHS